MIKKKKSIAKFLVLLWAITFFFGIYNVFLFLNGYPIFSFGEKEYQKGYITFSSEDNITFDNKFLGKGHFYNSYNIGMYTLCADSLIKNSRCFNDINVVANNDLSTKVEDIILLPKKGNTLINWTKEKIYFSEDLKGLFWYDNPKKQFFYLHDSFSGIRNYFLKESPKEIKKIKKDFYIVYEDESKEKIDFFKNSTSYFSDILENKFYEIGDFSIMKKNIFSLLDIDKKKVIALFDEKLSQRFLISDSGHEILVFPSSIFLFSPNREDFRLITKKDFNNPVVYISEIGRLYFIYKKQLQSIDI
jgi:hypothetical protein